MNSDKSFFSKLMFDIRIYVVIMLVFSVVTLAMGGFALGMAELFVCAVVGILGVLRKKHKEQRLNSYLEHINEYLASSAKGYMYNFPLPITVLDLTGTIVWYNEKFSDIFGSDNLERSISDVAKEIQILKIIENKDNISIDVTKDNDVYNVVGNVVETEEEKETSYSIVLYWINKTAEVRNYEKAVNSQIIACSVLIDNYDELVKNTPDTERSLLFSEIDRVIELWCDSVNGIYKKLEKDKYSVYFENSELQGLIDGKFNILDAVKEINQGNKIPATLSIGIGKGEGIRQSDEFVSAAMDMALGRGGDQAVIKDAEQFRFFGGHSEGSAKNTRVRARVVASALRELVDGADNIFIQGHKNADADCFGAAVACTAIAKARGKKAYIVMGAAQSGISKCIEKLKADEYYTDVFVSESAAMAYVTQNSLCIIVDTHNPNIVESPKLTEQIHDKVLIDHHRKGPDYISDCVLTYHEPYASSACELMTEIIQYISDDQDLTSAEAQAVYAGIVLDTKNFNMRTGVRTFEAAAFLRRKGVDTVEVKKLFQTDLDMYVKKAKIVSNAAIYNDSFVISAWPADEEYPNVIASQAADELLNITGVKASFVLCTHDNEIYISARSLGAYNVQLVMEQLGGGGHMTVAGAQLKDVQLSEAEGMLKTAIDNVE